MLFSYNNLEEFLKGTFKCQESSLQCTKFCKTAIEFNLKQWGVGARVVGCCKTNFDSALYAPLIEHMLLFLKKF